MAKKKIKNDIPPPNTLFVFTQEEYSLKEGVDFTQKKLLDFCNKRAKKNWTPKRVNRQYTPQDLYHYISRGFLPPTVGEYYVFRCYHLGTNMSWYKICPKINFYNFLQKNKKYLIDETLLGNILSS